MPAEAFSTHVTAPLADRVLARCKGIVIVVHINLLHCCIDIVLAWKASVLVFVCMHCEMPICLHCILV